MTSRRIVLVSVNLALIAMLAVVLRPVDGQKEAAPTRAARSILGSTAPVLATEPTIVPSSLKPLFARPPVATPVVERTEEPTPAVPPFRLAGVLWSDAERLAVVQMADGVGHRRIRLHDSIDNWTLSDLTPKAATFSAGDRRVVLMLSSQNTRNAEVD